jgi:hypothetical protein
MIGSDERISAEARPSAASARHLKAFADDGGEVFQDFAEIAAGRALDRDRRDEQWQVVLTDAEIKVSQRGFEIGAVGDLVGDDAELRPDRVFHFAPHHADRDRRRMAGAQAAHDDVETVGELRAELLLAPPAQDAQEQVRHDEPAEQADQDRMEEIAAHDECDCEGHDAEQREDDEELAQADCKAGLQHQPVERLEPDAVAAAAGKPALAPQLHQDVLAIGFVLEQLEAAIDVLAIRAARVAEQIHALEEQARGGRHQQIDQINWVEIQHDGQSGCDGSK